MEKVEDISGRLPDGSDYKGEPCSYVDAWNEFLNPFRAVGIQVHGFDPRITFIVEGSCLQMEMAQARFFRNLIMKDEEDSCPCKWGNPCSDECTCVNQGSSRGCQRCCKYGSEAQKRMMSDIIDSKMSR